MGAKVDNSILIIPNVYLNDDGCQGDNSMLIITNMYLDMGCQGRQLHLS